MQESESKLDPSPPCTNASVYLSAATSPLSHRNLMFYSRTNALWVIELTCLIVGKKSGMTSKKMCYSTDSWRSNAYGTQSNRLHTSGISSHVKFRLKWFWHVMTAVTITVLYPNIMISIIKDTHIGTVHHLLMLILYLCIVSFSHWSLRVWDLKHSNKPLIFYSAYHSFKITEILWFLVLQPPSWIVEWYCTLSYHRVKCFSIVTAYLANNNNNNIRIYIAPLLLLLQRR